MIKMTIETKEYAIYKYLDEDNKVAYVGQTKRGLVRHKEHLNEDEFYTNSEYSICAYELTKTQADAIESLIYMKLEDEGWTLYNKQFPNRKVLIKHADKLKTCPICKDLDCLLSEEQIQALVSGITKCYICNKEHKISSKDPNGNYICKSCYDKYYRPERPIVKCYICGKEHKRHSKDPNGNYICLSCNYKLKKQEKQMIQCNTCGTTHKKHRTDPKGNYICLLCWRELYNTKPQEQKPENPINKEIRKFFYNF
jgi:hypothetical protein